MVAHCSSLFSSTCAIASLVRTMEEQAYMHTTTTQWPVLARIRPKIEMQYFSFLCIAKLHRKSDMPKTAQTAKSSLTHPMNLRTRLFR